MKQRRSKVLSILLCCVMLIGLIPVSAHAEETGIEITGAVLRVDDFEAPAYGQPIKQPTIEIESITPAGAVSHVKTRSYFSHEEEDGYWYGVSGGTYETGKYAVYIYLETTDSDYQIVPGQFPEVMEFGGIEFFRASTGSKWIGYAHYFDIGAIDAVDVTVAVPVPGEAPGVAYSSDSRYYVASSGWEPSEAVFEEGKGYSVLVTLEAAEGYYFPEDISYTVNGEDAEIITRSKEEVKMYYDFSSYNLWVKGIKVSDSNKDDVLGELDEGSTVTFDPATSTLTLDNASIQEDDTSLSGDVMGIYSKMDLTLEVKGENAIAQTDTWIDYGILSTKDLTITGGGTLSIDDTCEEAIRMDGDADLTIENVTLRIYDCGVVTEEGIVTVNSGRIEAVGENYETGIEGDHLIINGGEHKLGTDCYIKLKKDFVMNGGTMTVESDYGMVSYGTVEINGGKLSMSPEEDMVGLYADEKITVNGGDVTIEGVVGCGGTIEINGGTVIVSTSEGNAIYCNAGVDLSGYPSPIVTVGMNAEGSDASLWDNTTPLAAPITSEEEKTYKYIKIEPNIVLPYKDVREGDWFYDYVYDVYVKKLMTGLSADTFGPANNLVRAQFAVILYRMEGEPEVGYQDTFPDVADGTFYSKAVIWAAENKIVTGYSSTGMFGPNDPITREQMAVMMFRYANYKGKDTSPREDLTPFPDDEKVQDFAVDALEWCTALEIITGKGTEKALDPQGSTNRAECATIISRYTNTVK